MLKQNNKIMFDCIKQITKKQKEQKMLFLNKKNNQQKQDQNICFSWRKASKKQL